MLLIVKRLSRTSKDKLFKILESIAKNEAELKRVTWGNADTLVLDLRPISGGFDITLLLREGIEHVSIETGGSKDEKGG